mmetsp:Transcript_12154/g.15157  ORF Transcript_12154/g.15157 Transcript_12154/m.15157 type:complete len:80 (-) Transcript_12154:266-505(-)
MSESKIVPYIGVVLDNDQMMVNFDKCRMLATVLLEFKELQQHHFGYTEIPQIQHAWLYSLSSNNEEVLYQRSISLEPKK